MCAIEQERVKIESEEEEYSSEDFDENKPLKGNRGGEQERDSHTRNMGKSMIE